MPTLRNFAAAFALLTACTLAAPSAAQFSDRYEFFKAVKDSDALKAKSVIDEPGSTIINQRDPENGEMALHMVTKRRDVPWINFLAMNGADINARDREGNTALMHAARLGFVDGIQVLTARNANVNLPNSRGETPLILAVQARNAPAVRALLAAGADPDMTDHVAGLSAFEYAERDRRAAEILRAIRDAKKRAADAKGATVDAAPAIAAPN